LLGFGLAVGEQRPAVVVDEVENDLFDRPATEAAVHLHSADDLTTKSPDVVAVAAQGGTRQRRVQQLAQERPEAFHYPLAVWNVTCLVRPAAWPLIEVRTPDVQGIGGSLLRR
jgi:hypothetical protein